MNFLNKLIFLPFFLIFLSACHLTKNVPQGEFLLKKNVVAISDNNTTLSTADLSYVIRQQPNQKTLTIPIKLFIFNAIDSAKVSRKRIRLNSEIKANNDRKIAKMNRINSKKILRAQKKHKEYYTEKIIPLQTLEDSRLFLREWLKYKYGQKPIVFDSILFEKSKEQMSLFLKRKGYYYGEVKGEILFKRKKTATAVYSIYTGQPYIIDSVFVKCGNSSVISAYNKFFKKNKESMGVEPLKGQLFDLDYLSAYREDVAKFMRNEALYGFNATNITMSVDTNKTTKKVILGIILGPRMIPSTVNKDSLVAVSQAPAKIHEVHYHLSDTSMLKIPFTTYLGNPSLEIKDSIDNQFLKTKNILFYKEIFFTKKKREEKNILVKDSLNPERMVYIHFNGKQPTVSADILELQNYLEMTNIYKEDYLERSYRSLNQLGVFSTIKPQIIELPGHALDVHYFLTPAKKQSFSFDPKFTSSFGLLGTAASIKYTNKNLFGGAEKLTLTLGGGFESQPAVFADGSRNGTSFNTFEFGPSVKLDIPGLFPTKVTLFSKRQKPRTLISVGYNYEKRAIFDRNVFQMNYNWKFLVSKTQIFQLGLPFASVIKYVAINNSPEFQSQINALNDLFLKNSYSNQFIWEDFKFSFEYNNKDKEFGGTKKTLLKHKFLNAQIYFTSSIETSGNLLSKFQKYQDTLANGQYEIFGLGYSQFFRNDNQYILARNFNPKSSMNLKLQAGFGIPFGNSKTAMPYDYSFFAGGSNDNRGWKARSLGPGSYKYYLDSTSTAAQIGDIRIGGSLEYRFSMGSMLKGAFFSDFGNIWTYNDDAARPGAKFGNNWYKQIAVAIGTGIRLDLDFFIIRLDLGLPIYNPALPDQARWIFQSREPYYADGIAYYGLSWQTAAQKRARALAYLPKPFLPSIQFGIGYPF